MAAREGVNAARTEETSLNDGTAAPLRILLVADASRRGTTAVSAAVARLASELAAYDVSATHVGTAAALRSQLESEAPDLVHVHVESSTMAAVTAIRATERLAIPVVLTLHAMTARLALLLAGSDALLGWSRRVVMAGVNSVVAAQAVRWMPEASIGILPLGVDLTAAQSPVTVRGAEDVRYLSHLGPGQRADGESLVRAFAGAVRFVAGAPHLALTIVGDVAERDLLVRLASELGVGDRVAFHARTSSDDLRIHGALADAFILADAGAGSTSAALEARAAGLPVIARLSSGARDFVSPGRHGLLARDDRELVQFIARIALDEPLRRFITSRNRAEPPPYDWGTIAHQHRTLYDVAVARSAPTAPPNHP